jgi:tetrahydromethanopterin S-methyltransferase subunit A
MDLNNWPSVAGRYYLGNKNSCVAVCTLASIDLLENFNKPEYLEKISVVGKSVTENVGIEKIVQNAITNPRIRFLILCGRESEGHSVGQALIALVEKGIDENKKIIDARGPIPYLKNLSKEQVEIFRKQVKMVDLIGVEDITTILAKAEECEKNNPGVFGGGVELENIRTIVADYDPKKEVSADGSLDEGWFNVFVDRERNLIVAEHYLGYGTAAKLNCKIVGKTSEQILGTVVKEKLVTQLYHVGYLGKELAKAEIALRQGTPYEQEGKLED